MNFLTFIIRIAYGLLFLVVGLNYFFNFIPMPPLAEAGSNFMLALAATGYMLPLNAGVQVVAGSMLLLNIFTPLALIVLAPVVVNILLFHIFLDPTVLGLAISLTVIECFLAVMYWDHYSHLFKKS